MHVFEKTSCIIYGTENKKKECEVDFKKSLKTYLFMFIISETKDTQINHSLVTFVKHVAHLRKEQNRKILIVI